MLSGITSVVGINIEKSLRYDYMLAATHMHELAGAQVLSQKALGRPGLRPA